MNQVTVTKYVTAFDFASEDLKMKCRMPLMCQESSKRLENAKAFAKEYPVPLVLGTKVQTLVSTEGPRSFFNTSSRLICH